MRLQPFLTLRFSALVLAILGGAAAARAQTLLPDATSGQAYSFTLITNPPQPSGTMYSADGLPSGLSIDGSSGTISGVTTAVGLYKGNLTFTSGSAATLFAYQITVDPAAGSPTITSNGSAFGTVGTPFAYTITASNSPASFNVAQLPPGLTSSGAQISGTPTTAGLYFTSTSANNAQGQGAILVLFFTISAAGPVPSLTSPAVASADAGSAFSYTVTATNSPTSFSATGLPSGLSLDPTTGALTGTPASPQVATIALTASNSYGSSPPRNLVLTIGSFSAITSAATASATAGSGFSYTLTASNSPVTFNVSGLPAGLTFNATSGAITGTPTQAGSYTLVASANNALGTGPSSAIALSVGDPTSGAAPSLAPVIVMQPSPLSATVGSTVQFSVGAAGTGATSYQWSRNGIPIAGQTGPVLALADVNEADAGTYTVFVSNPTGFTVSAPATLSIQSLLVPPIITGQPTNVSATAGSPVSLTVGAAGSGPLSYQWWANGSPVPGAASATLTIPSVQTADAGSYWAVVSNLAGSATSWQAALTVYASAFAPIFQFEPSATTVTAGGSATLSVGVVGSPPINYQWFEGSTEIPGATSASLTFAPVAASDAGTYSVMITDAAGTVTSSSAVLTVEPAGGPPVPISIALQPNPVSATVGGSATFSVAANGDAPVTYQWRRNQSPIPGATSPTFAIPDVQLSDAGTYDVEISNAFSADVSFPTPLYVIAGTPSHLVNVSVRGFSGTGPQALAIGFVVGGSGSENALVRAVGPTLSEFGLSGLLADPQLALYGSSQQVVASNDNWGGTTALTTAFEETGAFPLPPASLDSAVAAPLPAGAYTAQVVGSGGGTGIVLLELYDADTSPSPTADFINVSARGPSGAGASVLTAGFVIEGGSSRTLVIRGVGPTLSAFSVSGALAQPQLTVYDARGGVMGSNSGWGGTVALQAAFNAVGAFQLPASSLDSAVIVTLSPGAYTAEVSGAGGSTGIALLEVYEMP